MVSTARTSNIRRHLLKYARHAAEVGFTAAMCSDHFHPWSERQAQSGFAWSWLAAALEATPLSLDSRQLADLATPREFDRACENASRADVLARVHAACDISSHADLLELAGVGFDRVYVHSRAAIPGSVPRCAGALPNPAGVICR